METINTESRTTKRRRNEVAKLRDAEVSLSRRHLSLLEQLPAATAAAGTAMLASELDGTVSEPAALSRPAEMRQEIAAVAHAIDEARNRRRASIEEFNAARADDLAKQAAKLTSDAITRQTRTDRLLRDLDEHEGVTYRPTQVNDDFGRPAGRLIPATEVLRNQAESLAAEAERIRSTRLGASGTLTGGSLSELVEDLNALDPTVIGPAVAELHDWWQSAEGDFSAPPAGERAGGMRRRVEVMVTFGEGVVTGGSWRVVASPSEARAATVEELVDALAEFSTIDPGSLPARQTLADIREQIEAKTEARCEAIRQNGGVPEFVFQWSSSDPLSELADRVHGSEGGVMVVMQGDWTSPNERVIREGAA